MKREELAVVLKDRVPCKHIGCERHILKPCEGCGRIAARGQVKVPIELVKTWTAIKK